MKKRTLLYYLLTLLATFFMLTSCSEDDDLSKEIDAATSGEYWENMAGVYRGKMVANIDGVAVDTMYQQIKVVSDNRNRMTVSISSLLVDNMNWRNIAFRDVYFYNAGDRVSFQAQTVQNLGQVQNVSLYLEGMVKGEEMEFTLKASSVTIRPITLTMKAEKLSRLLSSETNIVKMKLNHPLVIGQPSFYASNSLGNVMVFYVPDTLNMDSTEILVQPEFELSKGATISYPDSVMDFSKQVNYTVWAEDSIHRTVFQIIWQKAMIQKFDFGRWQTDHGWSEPIAGWGTNNGMLKTFMDEGKYSGEYAVKRVKGWNVGEWAAEMRTVMTGEGEEQAIFAGSFYQGYFDLTMQEPLYGPVYGVLSMNGYAPNAVEGYYKYIPANQIYEGNSLLQDTMRVNDTCCIRAILYEIVNPDDRLDSLNYMNDTKVVAIAEMGTLAGRYQPDFTEFSIYFKYIRSYFPTKRYKIALICSSSRDAGKKRGGPGSVLTVGGIEVMYVNGKR